MSAWELFQGEPFYYLGFEFGKLKSSAVELDKLLGFWRLSLLIGRGCCLDGCRRLALEIYEFPFHRSDVYPTLQFLHFQTKLASPLLPLISLFSYCGLLALQ